MWGSDLIRIDNWYRDIVKQWQVKKYGFPPRGLFDLIYLNCRKIIDDKDTSEWAYDMIEICGSLLIQKIRYPWDYVPDNMAKNRLDELWSKIMYRLKITQHQKYGPITKLTRDPYIYFYTACVMLDRKQYIEAVKIPWYLNIHTRKTLRWRKYLITGKGYRKDYVILLDYYRSLAVKQLNQ